MFSQFFFQPYTLFVKVPNEQCFVEERQKDRERQLRQRDKRDKIEKEIDRQRDSETKRYRYTEIQRYRKTQREIKETRET
jgi:hypothetical protein